MKSCRCRKYSPLSPARQAGALSSGRTGIHGSRRAVSLFSRGGPISLEGGRPRPWRLASMRRLGLAMCREPGPSLDKFRACRCTSHYEARRRGAKAGTIKAGTGLRPSSGTGEYTDGGRRCTQFHGGRVFIASLAQLTDRWAGSQQEQRHREAPGGREAVSARRAGGRGRCRCSRHCGHGRRLVRPVQAPRRRPGTVGVGDVARTPEVGGRLGAWPVGKTRDPERVSARPPDRWARLTTNVMHWSYSVMGRPVRHHRPLCPAMHTRPEGWSSARLCG